MFDLKEYEENIVKLEYLNKYFISFKDHCCEIMTYILSEFYVDYLYITIAQLDPLVIHKSKYIIFNVHGSDLKSLSGTPYEYNGENKACFPYDLLFDENWKETVKRDALIKSII
jgi:hypothetical protein